MFKKAGFIIAPLVFVLLTGCGGGLGSVLQNINPNAGVYSGTITYTATSTTETFNFTVGSSGSMRGSFVDPDLGIGSMNGNMDSDGNASGTTLNAATTGTYTFAMTAGSGGHFTGTGDFKPGATDKAITFDVTKA